MRNSRRGACLVLGIVLLTAPVTRAQDEPSEGAEAGRYSDGAERAAEAIDVQDERARTRIFEDSPVETQVIRSEEIRRLPSRNAADVVNKLPGIRTQQRVQGEEAAVSIEGMPPEYTLILVNGQRYTGQLNEVADLADIPIENVERIEVLRGAQTLRYGSEAAGGVINIVTKRAPESGWNATLEGGGGDDGQIRGAGHGGVRVGDASFTASVDHDQIRGFDPCTDCDAVFVSGGSSESRLSNEDVYATGLYEGFEDVDLRSSFGWRMEDERIVPLEGNASDKNFRRYLGGGGLDWQAGEHTTVTSNVNYFDGFLDSTTGRSFTQGESELRVETFASHVLETGFVQHLIQAGGDARRQTIDIDEGPLPANLAQAELESGDVYSQFKILGLYLSDEMVFSEWASAIVGLRGELHSDFDGVALPSLNVLFRPSDWSRLRFQAAMNSRAPSLPDLYQPAVPQLGGTYFLLGNPDLTRETSYNLRGGFELDPWSWGSLSATYFWNDIRDLIRSVPVEPITIGFGAPTLALLDQSLLCRNYFNAGNFNNPTLNARCLTTIPGEAIQSPAFQKTNLNRVRTQGVETQLLLHPLEYADLTVAYTFQLTSLDDPELPDVDELANEPVHVVDLEANLRNPWTDTVITPRARFRSRALVEGSGTGLASFISGDYSEPSWIVDLRVSQPIFDRYEAYFDLRNLTDTEVVDSYQVRGTNFFVGIRIALGPLPGRRNSP